MTRFAARRLALVSAAFAAVAPAAEAASAPPTVQLPTFALIANAGEITSVLATLNGGFFNQNNAFVSSPAGTRTDQVGGGLWLRPTGGTFNTTVSGITPAATVSSSNVLSLQTRSEFIGVQAGGDVARYDFGNSGYSVNLGVTGGELTVHSTGRTSGVGSTGTADFEIPFVGVYAAFAGHGFFGDAIFREDILNVTAQQSGIPGTLSFPLTSSTFAASGGYRYNSPYDFYLVPGIGISISELQGKSTSIPPTSVTAAGVARLDSVDSDLGKLQLTVGRDFALPEFVLSPFVTGTVFHEFAGDTKLSFSPMGTGVPQLDGQTFQGSVSRIGTFEQVSLGVNVAKPTTNLVSFVRGDIRTGDHVDGYSVSGGVRYSF